MSTHELPSHLIFYDGACAMCNGIVKWLLRVDRRGVFSFAALEGETADRARLLYPTMHVDIDTMVYVRDGAVFLRSRGALEAMRELPYPWKVVSWLRVLPAWLTDAFYRLVAASRYRLFGRYDECPLPPAAHRPRFLP